MDDEFWLKRWQTNEIGFHQARTNDLLQRHWPAVSAPAGSQVFVPLCGKSLDMIWLAGQGHHVTGAELSELAVDAFFAEAQLEPVTTKDDAFTIKNAGPFTLLCGDVFDLTPQHLKGVQAVYDRAALIALTSPMRARYAGKLSETVPTAAPMLVVTIDYNEAEMTGPPFPVPPSEIESLFSAAFDIATLETRDGLTTSVNLKARGVTWVEERAYLLRRRA